MTIFSKNLKKALKDRNMTLSSLANKLNLHRTNVCRWTTGKVVPRIDTLMKICEILEISPNELLGYDKEKN